MARPDPFAGLPDDQRAIVQGLLAGIDSGQLTPDAVFDALMGGFSPRGAWSLGALPDRTIEVPDPPEEPLLLTVKVMLDDAHPPIWRRLELRGDLTLDAVHDRIQAAMGWWDGHLHHFVPGPVKQRWRAQAFLTAYDIEVEGEEGTAEADVRLDQVLRAKGDRLFYTYDFGDDWAHTITVERVREATDHDPAALCLKAVRACPPEDVGGIHTWNELAATLRDHPDPRALTGDHEMYADWLPADIDPERADVDEINAALAAVGTDPSATRVLLGDPSVGLGDAHPAYVQLMSRAGPESMDALRRMYAEATAETTLVADADLVAVLRPWLVLLDLASEDGIPLSKAGWMAPAACERLWTEGGLDWGYGKGNREQHTPEISQVREVARHAGIARTHKGRVVRTRLGRAASTDVHVLADAIGGTLLRADGAVTSDERLLAVMLLASGAEPEVTTPGPGYGPVEAFLDEVAELLTLVGWRVGDGPVHRHEIHDARHVLHVLQLGEGAVHGRRLPGPAARAVARRALLSRP